MSNAERQAKGKEISKEAIPVIQRDSGGICKGLHAGVERSGMCADPKTLRRYTGEGLDVNGLKKKM